jgi:predicted Zn-dependent protease
LFAVHIILVNCIVAALDLIYLDMKLEKIFFLFFIPVSACTHNAFTGKNQLSVYPESEMQTMASEQYKQFLDAHKVISPEESKDAAMLQRVGERVKNAVIAYYTKQGLDKQLSGYNWEYHLIDSKEVNAWCMPGGKIAVYTGLLPFTQDESALAIVLGHQIAHTLAKHGNERMNQSMVQQLGGIALAVAQVNQPTETQGLFMNAYGAGSDAGAIIPFSRNQELEADRLSLNFAILAGYDPHGAVPVWEGMKKASANIRIMEIISIHPVDGKRIEQLKHDIDQVEEQYPE